MTSFDSTTTSKAPTGSRALRLIGDMFHALSAWNDERITRKSLSRLTARELDDIGVTRSDIDRIAARGSRF